MKVVNQVDPSPERLQEFFGVAEDGPFVMANLLRASAFERIEGKRAKECVH